MSNNLNFYETAADAGNSRAMEAENHFKNGASPKNHKSSNVKYMKNFLIRGLTLRNIFVALFFCPLLLVGQENCVNLYPTGVSPDGFITLEWQWLTPPAGTYGYTLYQWDSVVGWQSTSTHCDDSIRVLNVYPDIEDSNTLKTWMDDPNIGLEKILVTPVTISDFNANPDFYLKSDGEYIYDVIMFGSWDSNNDKNLTLISVTAVENFLKSGRGVLFGHDTQHWSRNFALLADYTNLYITESTIPLFRGSIHVKVVNDGFLLKYPHLIPYNDILTIPCTHTSCQYAKGIVWMNFPDQEGNCFHADINELEGGTNDFYLTTWNNAAMIQTGHSSGQSTPDERKILANTLWYLSQFTTDTTAKICSAFDLAAPDMPTVSTTGNCHLINIVSEDNGTPYSFYVKAINMVDNADTCTSNIVDVINKTGLMGFYVLEDDNPVSDPDISSNYTAFIPAADNQSVSYTIQDLTQYVHIQAVDAVGNLSEIFALNPSGTYNISVFANSGGTVTGDSAYSCNQQATVNAYPDPNYYFVNWTENGFVVSTNAVYSFIVTKDRNLVANFIMGCNCINIHPKNRRRNE